MAQVERVRYERSKAEPYVKRLLELGAADAVAIDPRDVVTGEWVRWKCRYGCGGYGRRLTCPPHSPTPGETRALLGGYRLGVLAHWTGELRPSASMVAVEREAFLDGWHQALALGEGPCRLCEACNLERCAHPQEARPSMEACGIDVFATARAQGLPIHPLRERNEPHNLYGLLLLG